ncbi:MAG TPA: M81 family metallopeptidase [Burkholderiaceae bacterium]|nr:M81 family metallopeptidase [Burkholderiaceae bacterium]
MSVDARRRLFVARFWYEGNSFGPLPADLAAFERCEWHRGEAAVAASAGTLRELAAIPGFRDRHPGWEIVVSRAASAIPAGPIDDAVFDAFLAEVLADLRAETLGGGLDAVYLSLHGAAMTRTRPHADLDVVEAVRAAVPGLPIAATFDMHGNHPERLGPLLTLAAGYRTHPHLDMRELAARTLDRLADVVERGVATRACVINAGILLPSINMRTADGPMRGLQALAAEAEREPGVLAASVFGGFPYADAPHAGAGTMVYTDASADPDGALARRVASRLADALRAAKPAFFVDLPSPEDAIARALATDAPGLVAVTDAADNPYSGGANDTPGLLPALLAASPAVPCVFASFADPGLVARAREAGVGRAFDASLGATHGDRFGAAVRLRARPLRFTDGRYAGTEGLLTGTDVRCGDTVLLAVDGRPNLRIVVTSRVDPGIDPGFYALHGLDLARERLLLVKGKNHFRAGVGRRCAAIVDADAPGPACLDFTRLPYRHLRLPHGYDRPAR